ncbi:MAG: hypothetical protein M3Y67_08985, partial [Pseudomonadota bacterium]|nr:hypothetical protein [Pseudomonadota bacterium]
MLFGDSVNSQFNGLLDVLRLTLEALTVWRSDKSFRINDLARDLCAALGMSRRFLGDLRVWIWACAAVFGERLGNTGCCFGQTRLL